MMKVILTLLAAAVTVLFLPSAHFAYAMTFTVTGTNVDATYTEPSTNANGTPLTDLAKTTIYYDLGAGPVVAKIVPATALTGGGNVATTITVPVLEGQEADVRFFVTASDTSGNESARSGEVIKRIDRLAPGPPN